MKRTKQQSISTQVKQKVSKKVQKSSALDGNIETMISTGSTLLDLAISGTRVRGGGLPGGIMVEVFGPSSTGKTVLLCEIAGGIQRASGDIMFHDPEGRLNKQFASVFRLNTDDMSYAQPDTVTEVFTKVRKWEPNGKINGIMADSLAALSTDLEMGDDEGDKMGMRRAKEFSEQMRRTCRVLAQKNHLMVCSNQIREKTGVTFGLKYKSPGGEAIGFYSSLRLRTIKSDKIWNKTTYRGKDIKEVIGITTEVEVFKSSVDKPYRTAPLTINFTYGIDDIRENLKFIKSFSKESVYTLGERKLDKSLNGSIKIIESENAEDELREEVIDLWESIQHKLSIERKPKDR